MKGHISLWTIPEYLKRHFRYLSDSEIHSFYCYSYRSQYGADVSVTYRRVCFLVLDSNGFDSKGFYSNGFDSNDFHSKCFDSNDLGSKCFDFKCFDSKCFESNDFDTNDSDSKKGTRFFHIIFAHTLTGHTLCLTHITPSGLIYANVLGYILCIKVEFVMRNIMSIYLCCCLWKGGHDSTSSRSIEKRQIKLIISIICICFTCKQDYFFL